MLANHSIDPLSRNQKWNTRDEMKTLTYTTYEQNNARSMQCKHSIPQSENSFHFPGLFGNNSRRVECCNSIRTYNIDWIDIYLCIIYIHRREITCYRFLIEGCSPTMQPELYSQATRANNAENSLTLPHTHTHTPSLITLHRCASLSVCVLVRVRVNLNRENLTLPQQLSALDKTVSPVSIRCQGNNACAAQPHGYTRLMPTK